MSDYPLSAGSYKRDPSTNSAKPGFGGSLWEQWSFQGPLGPPLMVAVAFANLRTGPTSIKPGEESEM